MDPKSKAFKKLQSEWYKKLADDGFEDIENGEDGLKVYSTEFSRKRSMVSWEAKASYYYMAENFLRDYTFDDATEKFIWTEHAEAVSIRDITAKLKDQGIKTNRLKVNKIINRLTDIMKKRYAVK